MYHSGHIVLFPGTSANGRYAAGILFVFLPLVAVVWYTRSLQKSKNDLVQQIALRHSHTHCKAFGALPSICSTQLLGSNSLFLRVDSPFCSTIVLFKTRPVILVSGGFLERRIPGKNGEGSTRVSPLRAEGPAAQRASGDMVGSQSQTFLFLTRSPSSALLPIFWGRIPLLK